MVKIMMDKKRCAILIKSIALFIFSVLTACNSPEKSDNAWKAPRDADKLKNPFSITTLTEQKGQILYNLYCRSCHGETGLGDGAAGRDLAAKPANFHSEQVKNESNGAILWKLTHGNKSMPGFKDVLSEEERWQLVSYIRKLPDQSSPLVIPVALHPDIKVEHVMTIGPQAVRILQHPASGDLWYTTFDGDLFQIKDINSKKPAAEKIYSVKDHGIAVLQGAVFLDSSLYLCGNVYSADKKTTKGRMVRFNLQPAGQHKMTVVFNTVEYAANKTIYDHGWNAMVISPDKKYIYVNSGARTDHGEVQDNGGLYPNARDNALTSKIFRIPVDSTDLELPDNEATLKANGFLFASGIRNAYDMAFDPDGNLFGVSNSADYDYPEDMFWIREHHHYGFPWVMGGLENPQQYKDWQPNPDTDPFINKTSHSWKVKYYYNDPGFPQKHVGIRFSPGVQNIGPDANEYRGHSGKIQDGDQTGVTMSTFTAHCCPLGLFFDTKKMLAKDFKGDGFVIRYSLGARSALMRPFTNEGADLLHLHLTYDAVTDNYFVKTIRVVEGFKEPVDAVMVDNNVYIIEFGGEQGNIWKIILPKETTPKTKKIPAKKKG